MLAQYIDRDSKESAALAAAVRILQCAFQASDSVLGDRLLLGAIVYLAAQQPDLVVLL
jgi:hypothetical protein